MRVGAVIVAVGVGVCVAAAIAACTGEDATTPGGSADASADGGGLKANGAACMGGGECLTGSCADGVCCDTACKGTCESCNQGGSAGKCFPIPAGQDPDGECKPQALPADDGGVGAAGDAGDAGDDGGDGGSTLNLPDAGLSGKEAPCTGSCDGNRGCAYPSASTTCGTTFCNSATTLARLACNGGGHCTDLALDDCQGYVCKDGTSSSVCGKTCSQSGDCDATHFCDGLSSTCKPKKGLGVACNVAAECASGNCVGGPPGVCCNSVCNFSGASCATGTCKCSACADPAGSCILFYRDNDGDTYGDPNVTTTGCDLSPPGGYVLDHTDCDDGNPLVHPGAGFQSSAIIGGPKAGTFDYNCDGTETKETHDSLGSTTCNYCGYVNVGGLLTCEAASATCGIAGQTGGFDCKTQSCNGGILAQCCGHTSGFPPAVACGTTSTLYTCQPCPTAGSTFPVVTTPNVLERCK
jgi:hypothetical protein